MLPELVPVRPCGQHDPAGSVQAQDLRLVLERAEHDRDLPVLAQVRDSLRTAASQIEVGHRGRPEYREGVPVSLRGDVDVAAAPFGGQARSSRHEEDRLPGDKLSEPLIQFRVDLAHDALLRALSDETGGRVERDPASRGGTA